MNKIEEKINYLYSKSIITKEIVLRINNDYLKRIISRELFICIDSLLIYIPQLKNKYSTNSIINITDKEDIEKLIEILKKDYNGAYDSIRDLFAAHRPSLELIKTFEYWNDIDKTTMTILFDLINDIITKLNNNKSFIDSNIIKSTNINYFIYILNSNFPQLSTPNISHDNLSLTRKNTAGLIPCHPDQEKSSRICSIIDFYFNLLKIREFTIGRKIIQDIIDGLLLNDIFNIIDNIFENRDGDDSLITMWLKASYDGSVVLSNYKRKIDLEKNYRNLRNHFSAHLDKSLELQEIIQEYKSSNILEIIIYTNNIIDHLYYAFSLDYKTKMFLIQNSIFEGIIEIEKNEYKEFDK